MLKLAIAGAAGRMGGALIHAAERTDGVAVSVALEHPASSSLGKDAGAVAGVGALGVPIRAAKPEADSSPADRFNVDFDFDILLEFTTPQATMEHVHACRRARRGMVIGTTGMTDAEQQRIRQAAADIPIVLAANTSVGINLCLALLATAGKVLAGDPQYDVEVLEAHHRNKVDAPSGTALLLAQAVAAPLGKQLKQDGVFARHGHTGARKAGSIGFSTIRGGDIAGEHTVMFIGDGERLEITHKATDRRIFADGAIKAAKWLANQQAGLFTMQDVLGLSADNR